MAARPKRSRAVTRDSDYHRLLGLKAAEIAERVLPLFEKERPGDTRPRDAIAAIRAWANGERELGMGEVRRLSLDAHAAARECRTDAATFAARAAGQAVATWHVPTHALGAPMYAEKAKAAARMAKRSKPGSPFRQNLT